MLPAIRGFAIVRGKPDEIRKQENRKAEKDFCWLKLTESMTMAIERNAEIIYGVNPAFELLRAGRRGMKHAWLLSGAAKNARLKKLASMLSDSGAPVELVEKDKLYRHCRSREHQGVVLSVEPYPYVALSELLNSPRLLLLDNVEDPQNVGAILRSAEIFGWRDVLLSNKGVPEIYASVVKASAGATEHLRICRECSAIACVRRAIEAGYKILALDSRGREDLTRIAEAGMEKMLLVIGGEHHSVGQYILNQSHHVVGIPQKGKVRSLNASVAAGIALFTLQ